MNNNVVLNDVVLVVPPILSVARPSLGISAMKSALAGIGCEPKVVYAALQYAEILGADLNQQLAEQTDHRLLAGDWIFAGCVFPERDAHRDAHYLSQVVQPKVSPEILSAIIDARAHAREFVEACAREICAAEPKLVGFTSTFQQHLAALAIAREIKRLSPGVIICFGGANCEDDMGRATVENFPFVDVVFSGESDRSFPEFVKRFVLNQEKPYDPLSFFPVLSTRRPGFVEPGFAEPITDLDELPIPDFSDYFGALRRASFGGRVDPALTFEASRGCWWGAKHHCTFCGLNGGSMAFRAKSPERVLHEIHELSGRWSVNSFSPSDNILAPRHIEEVFGKIPPDTDLRFFFEIKSNMSHDQILKIARGGVTWLQPGIESLSDRVLKLMDKGVSGLLNLRFLRSCLEIGIVPLWNMLVGFPGEEDAEYEAITRLVPYVEHLNPPLNGPTFIRVDRFSPYFTGKASINFDSIQPLEAYEYVYDLAPAERRRIAYFFAGRSTRMISPRVHAELGVAMVNWRKRFWDPENPPILASIPFGESLLVRDTRSIAKEAVTELSPLEAQVLDRARSPVKIEALIAATGAPVEVEKLLNLGFLIRIAGEVLSVVKEFGWEVRNFSDRNVQPCGSLRPLTAAVASQMSDDQRQTVPA
jgi:ribosomal peptide maturation radical SAM protein 1